MLGRRLRGLRGDWGGVGMVGGLEVKEREWKEEVVGVGGWVYWCEGDGESECKGVIY